MNERQVLKTLNKIQTNLCLRNCLAMQRRAVPPDEKSYAVSCVSDESDATRREELRRDVIRDKCPT